ncbi:peptide deformylase [Oryzomonas sagensis]|uniref:Peptide deformylase n=1 Tax=Oryzomonas sagensis TaxID=2603857 RepID=A0ABQ6TSV2_9BACT|nr:peptide deformylase [Oryzomonas sagensis]KAB0671864.1 peptide deformylase [Oryzomonas sagensis]
MPILRQIAQLGQPVLRQETACVGNPADPLIQTLIDDMLATMAEANGVGIAAPQVFEPLRLFIVASHPNPRYPQAPVMAPTAMLNPEILWRSDEIEQGWEGCLSVPGIRGLVPRSLRIGVRYLSRGGGVCEEELSGFIARVFQHEHDHISGMVFLDRVASNRDLISEREYLRLVSA